MPENNIPTWPWSVFKAPTPKRDHHAEGDHVDSNAPPTTSRQEQDPSVLARLAGPRETHALGYAPVGDSVQIIADAQNNTTRKRFPDLASHGRAGPALPDYGVVYDQLRTREAYDKVVMNTAHGSITVGAVIQAPSVTLDTPPLLRLSEFPGGTRVYPVILLLTFSQSSLSTTGQYTLEFQPLGGDFRIPLGEYNASTGQTYNTMRWIINAPLTDRGQTAMGNLIFTPTGVVGAPTLLWRLGFGWAYLVDAPAFHGYIPMRAGDGQKTMIQEEMDILRQGD